MAMANPLKQLAGQTMIYGLSTILARIINFLFVPIYTRLLSPESYGVVTEFMAYKQNDDQSHEKDWSSFYSCEGVVAGLRR